MIPQLRLNSASEPGKVLSSAFRKSMLIENETIAKLRKSWPSFLKFAEIMCILLKGQCHEIFDLMFFSSAVS
jgi:hypothetical protein